MNDVLTLLAGQSERTVTTVGERSVVRVSRSYDTTVDDLWSAWTDPGRLARWIGVVTGDLREGGVAELCMTPPDRNIATLEVLRCDAPRRLVVRWTWPGEADSIVEVALVADGPERTVLTLEHLPLVRTKAVDYGGGWEEFLFRLDAYLAGNDPGTLSWDEVNAVIGPRWDSLLAGAGDDGRWPSVEPAGDARVIRASHAVPVAPSRVWSALTTPEGLGWFGAFTGELSVGGDWAVTWEQGSATGTVAECEPGRRFVTSWRWGHEPADAPAGTVTVTLTPQSPGTLVELRHEHVGDAAIGYGAGWYAHLTGLEAALLGRPHVEADWQADWEAAYAMLLP